MSYNLKRFITTLSVGALLSTSLSGCFSIRGILKELTAQTATQKTMTSYIPTQISNINTQHDDVIIGSIVVGNQMFFFANRGKGTKLYSVDPAGTITQRSNTNDNGYGVGDDHNWVGGFHYVDNAIYFDAFDNDGRIKFYRLLPSDMNLVTTPFVKINTTKTGNILPTQVKFTGLALPALEQRGDDMPYAGVFHPVLMGSLLYFTAYDGSEYEVYSYDATTQALTAITNIGWNEPTFKAAPYITGVNAGVMSIIQVDSGGTSQLYHYSAGDPVVTTAVGNFDLGNDYALSITSGITFGGKNYFVDNTTTSQLLFYEADNAAPDKASDTGNGGTDLASDIVEIGGTIFFSAVGASGDREIYRYNPGGMISTAPIADVCGAACVRGVRPLGLMGGKLYFSGLDANYNLKTYKMTPGNNATTQVAFTLNNTVGDDQPKELTEVNGVLYFTAFSGSVYHDYNGLNMAPGSGSDGLGARKVYRFDPANDTAPVMISNTVNSATQTDDPSGLISVRGMLFWTALDTSGYRRLFKYENGVTMGVVRTMDAISNTGSGVLDDSVGGLYKGVDGELYFSAQDDMGMYQTYTYANAVVQSADALAVGSDPGPAPQEYAGQVGWYVPGTDIVLPKAITVAQNTVFKMEMFANNVLNFFSLPNAFAAPIDYVRLSGGGGPATYARIRTSGGPAQYMRICDAYGTGTGGITTNGTTQPDFLMTGAYNPGTDRCGFVSFNYTDGFVDSPFPDMGGGGADLGSDRSSAVVFNSSDHKFSLFRDGTLRPQRSIRLSHLYQYEDSTIVSEIKLAAGRNEMPSKVVKVGSSYYYSMNDCGGQVAMNAPAQSPYSDCYHIYKYTP